MALAHFRMLIQEFLNKDPDIVTEEAPLIVLDSKSAIYMAKNGKYTKHTIHIARRMHFVVLNENSVEGKPYINRESKILELTI